jgi:hypothetical protein
MGRIRSDDDEARADRARWLKVGTACKQLLKRLRQFHPEKEKENGTRRQAEVPSFGGGSGELGQRLLSKRPSGFEPRRLHQQRNPRQGSRR